MLLSQTVRSLPDEKKRLFKDLGLRAETLDFSRVRSLSAQQFFNRLLNHFDCGGLLIGADFAFGKNREGSAVFLREACSQKNIPFEVAPFFTEDHEKISFDPCRARGPHRLREQEYQP